jgi:hypothetical protein
MLVCVGIVCTLSLGAGAARAGDPPPAAREAAAAVESQVAEMDAAAGRARARLATAAVRRDAATSRCVREKLSGMEAAIRRARDLRAAAREAIAHDDSAGLTQAQASLAQLAQEVATLGSASDACGAVRGSEMLEQEVTMAQVSAPEPAADMPSGGDYRDEAPPAPTPVSAPPPAPAAPPPQAPPARPAGSPYATEAPHEATMLVYTADITLAVFEVEKGLAAVEAVANDTGGYLSQRSDQQIIIRVPRTRFSDAMLAVTKLGDVLHKNVSAEDVTDEYVDLDLRLKNARATRDRLEALLATASVKEAVEINAELAKVTEEIERMEGRIKLLRDRIGFSTITVSFQAAPAPQPVQSSARLPFPWMQSLGLSRLLRM